MTLPDDARSALSRVLREIIDGPPPREAAFILNPGDRGLLASLERLTPEAAGAVPASGGATIAAHVDHLRYGLGLMNRWSRGEDPFGEADYTASWRRQAVTAAEWRELLDGLRREADAWISAVGEPRDLDEMALAAVLASAAHLAYHFGAIRQIDRTLAGPPASLDDNQGAPGAVEGRQD